jgi:Ca2+-binding RTX toxin-like protein
MTGKGGNDTYVVDNIGDKVIEVAKGGTDTIESSITFSLAALTNVENLTLTGSGNINGTGMPLANQITGNTGNNTLDGGAGNDTLDGGAGNDILTGGLGVDDLTGGKGNDTYNVSQSDVVHEDLGEGADLVKMTATVADLTFDLSTKYQNVENFTLLGALAGSVIGNDLDKTIAGNAVANTLNGGFGNDTLIGGAGNDTLLGGIGEDFLDGGTGKDKMTGGAGNDIYVIDIAGETIDEGANTDTGDVVRSSITVNLTTLGAGAIEHAVLTGATAINATGNGAANDLMGNTVANTIDGGIGNDALRGAAGNDTLIGGADDDFLDGGAGKDKMTGGAGLDSSTIRASPRATQGSTSRISRRALAVMFSTWQIY